MGPVLATRKLPFPHEVFLMMLRNLRPAALAAAAALCFSAASVSPVAFAQSSGSQAPDNTAQNKGQVQTADSQSNAKSDRETTAKIRKAIVSDKNLSTSAHNVKVITVSGQVTLKGPVQTEDEKQRVATIAANVVSPDKIVNDLTVKQ